MAAILHLWIAFAIRNLKAMILMTSLLRIAAELFDGMSLNFLTSNLFIITSEPAYKNDTVYLSISGIFD